MKNKLILLILLLASSLTYAQTMGSFTDSRTGQTYKTVSYQDHLLGTKLTIMAENLNYKTTGSYAYNNNEQYRKNLGLLYTWAAAKNACPSGWHLPSDGEWSLIISLIGSTSTAGKAMKSTKGWLENSNSTNSSGFNGMPAGSRFPATGGVFAGIRKYGFFWSSTELSDDSAWERALLYHNSEVKRSNNPKTSGSSVRCLQD